MASRLSQCVALRGAIRTPTATLHRFAQRACYSTEHHYTGNTGEHHAHQDAMPKPRNFAAAVGDKMNPKQKQEPWQPLNPQQWEGSSSNNKNAGGGQQGKKWDPVEREWVDEEWDNIGNL
ncbi:hypothetical protein PG996_006910 [Apiospora saccharicola]|uniref:Succinate dehydrogenase assembly factor 4, mitochondrial n=1 Tax=Apiospora saccharicola TaxID=335842 RepID=A0ABR1V9B9_9PEZI